MIESSKNLVSIIITTHNRENLLKRAINSVKNQTYDNFECIVVDDASDYNIKKSLINVLDDRFKLIEISKYETKGGNYARNLGILNSKGKYIAFLDDDDYYANDKIEKQVEILDKYEDYGIVYCTRTFVNGNYMYEEKIDKTLQGDCSKKIFYNIIGVTSTIMIRKNLLENIKFDENLKFWQEYDLMTRLCQLSNVFLINEPLVYYTVSNNINRLSNKFEEWQEAVKYINKKYSNLIDKLDSEEKLLREKMICYDSCSRLDACGRRKERKLYLKRIYKITHSFKDLIKYILNIDGNDLVKIKVLLKS
ncbi:MAG: glycosyltransferase family 2 protein [Clostridiales bacterium]|nr:glycosyltransferase family 2 protein [Clostridiales bacterium]